MSETTDSSATIEAPTGGEALPEWSLIKKAGGIHNWVLSELRKKGLLDEGVDTSRLSDKERKAYKARREEERRVRRILKAHAWASYKKSNLVHLGAGVFHHDTADVDRYDIADLPGRREANELPEIKDATALAEALELSIGRLRFLSFHREVDTGTHYKRWTIPKRDGRLRLISSPKPDLKKAQRWIARQITERLPIHGAAHGFVVGRSTVTNAAAHAGASVVVKMDLSDFYPTITLKRVKGMFRKAGYGEQVATVLALLCTESPREEMQLKGKTHYVAIGPRSLPQGAPTSPSITNAISLRLDCRLSGLAKKWGLTYTRYADDLTFSCKRKKAPVGKLIDAVTRIVEDEGFEVRPEKTRIMRAGGRQKVTGLVVNALARPEEAAEARLPRRKRRQLRAALHKLEHGGEAKESLNELHGWAAYLNMSDEARGQAMLERVAALKVSALKKAAQKKAAEDAAAEGDADAATTTSASAEEREQ